MKPKQNSLRAIASALLLCVAAIAAQGSSFAASYELQGQSRGSSSWIAGNLMNWRELDYIPCRIYITGGPVVNQTITLSFPHLNGTTPGFEDLLSFTTSANATTTQPILNMAPSGTWSYTFKVSVTNSSAAYVQFNARLAAGAHLNPGSSLMLSGNPTSMGNLQIHKPAPGPGAPNLAIVKTGPATTSPGATITYTLSYTNKATSTNTAYGTQISDILPAGLSVSSNGVNGGSISGNTVFWDLGNVAPGASGKISFQAQVSPSAVNGQVLTNFAQILSSEDDAIYTDNSSKATTTVIITCIPASITTSPLSQTNCPATPVTFSVTANGSAPLQYQWRKNGNALAVETNNTYSIASASASDTAAYDVIVSNGGGSITSAPALFVVNQPVGATPLANQINCVGTTASFSTTASGTGPFTYAWFKNGQALGQTGSSITLNNVSSNDQGTYAVIVSGACGSVTNSATLTVNTPVSATALVNQTNCSGTTVVFSTVASGTGPFTYAWLKNGQAFSQTGSSITLNNVSSNDHGTYAVIVSGACGSVTNSAVLAVNQQTSVAPIANQVRNPGETAVFNAVASGTGPFTYVWKKNGNILANQANSLVLSNLTAADDATYTVVATGSCNAAEQTASLHINVAPTVVILNPTNGAVFAAPASFTVTANAQDIDGSVTNVEFFQGTNKLGETIIGNPYSINLSSLAAGNYTFTAKATDNGGLSTTSAPVTISVIAQLPISLLNTIHFNPQTGLYEQSVRITNPSLNKVSGVRLYIYGLNVTTTVYNASGNSNGVPYVQSSAIPAGSYIDMTIEYHLTASGIPTPTLVAQIVPANDGGTTVALGTSVRINRGLMKAEGFMVEFMTDTNNSYHIQYSSDLKTWKEASSPVTGNGTWNQWIDNGQPKTESAPSTTSMRFYRVIATPNN